jgi:hypothetical protein
MTEPGVYELHYRRASLGEIWRMSDVIGGPRTLAFVIGLAMKLLGKRGQRAWLPPSETLADCADEDLTEEARAHLAPVVEQLGRLGYRRGSFRRVARNVSPSIRDAAAFRALHDDGRRAMVVLYMHYAHGTDPRVPVCRRVCLSGLVVAEDLTGTAVHDHAFHFDPVLTRAIRVGPVGAEGIDSRLRQEMAAMSKPLREFATPEELQTVLDERVERSYEQLLRRGLYQRMPEEEEQELLRQLGV